MISCRIGSKPGSTVMEMDRERVFRSVVPELPDRTGEQTQHAPNALEVGKCCRLVGERCEKFRMKRIPFAQSLDPLADRIRLRQGVAIVLPDPTIRLDHSCCRRVVDAFE